MKNTKILITGANGLLGRHALSTFKDHYEVHAVVRSMPENPIEDVNYLVIDLTQDWSLDLLPSSVDVIIHLAQSDLFRDFPNHSLKVFNVNVSSTAKLLEYAYRIGIKKFIFTSTGGFYDTGLTAVNENSPINTFGQLGNYFATKLCSEILTHNYTDYFDVTLLRLFFMYGHGQKRSMLLPRLVDNIRAGRPISLTANGGIKINPIHVLDVVEILGKLITFEGSYTFNVAGPETLTIKEISELIQKKIGIQAHYDCSDEVRNNCIADIRLLSDLVLEPTIRLKDKLEDIL